MKRTIASTLPLLALLVAAARVPAQYQTEPWDEAEAKERYLGAQRHVLKIYQQFMAGREKGQAVEPQELRKKIRPLVEESFEARQRLQKAEVEAIRRRLADIEQAINNREKNKEAIIDARIEDVLAGKVEGSVRTETSQDAELVNVPTATPRSTSGAAREKASSRPDEQRELPEFDIETRERLAKLDLQAAEEDYVASEKVLSSTRKQYQNARMPYTSVLASEKEHRHAAIAVERAKLRLDGLARQRAELEAKTDAAVAEASGEEQKARAKLRICLADVDTAKARLVAAESDVATAQATSQHRETESQRTKRLVEAKAVEPTLAEEAEEHRVTAKAGLEGAKAALLVARANLEQSKATVEEAQAELDLAEARLRAARLQRDRLGRHAPEGEPQPVDADKSGAANRE